MESVVVQIALYTVAVWAWVWLVSAARRDLPVAIYVQQNLGMPTPRSFYQLARRWRWLAAGGLIAIVVAGLVPEARAGVAVTALVVAVGLLTYIRQKMTRFLDPRVVSAVVRAPRRGDGPDEPLSAA